MKVLLLVFALLPLYSFSQLSYDKAQSDNYKYNEVGDTIFVNDKAFAPGDTLYLGNGSAPGGGFLSIFEQANTKKITLSGKLKYLPKEYAGRYLIFVGRELIPGVGANLYEPVFRTDTPKPKRYTVVFFPAIKTRELKQF